MTDRIFAVIVNFQSDEQVANLAKLVKTEVAKVIVIDNNKINRGFAKGVNLAVKQALKEKADSILLLNPDVEITRKQIAELAETPGDIVGPVLTFTRQGKKVYDFGGKVNWLLGRTTHIEFSQGDALQKKSGSKASPYKVEYISGACMLIDKKVFEKIGLFDERFFLYFEDVDFCLRAKKAGFSVSINPGIIVEHQIVEHRLSHDVSKNHQILRSNFLFSQKWVPWFFRPASYLYLFFLRLRILLS